MNKEVLVTLIEVIKSEVECLKRTIEDSDEETKARLQAMLNELLVELSRFEEKSKEVE